MEEKGWKVVIWALAVLALAAGGAPAAAQPFPPSPPGRRETVAGWRVVHTYDEDGGRDVGMSTNRERVRIDYYVNYWRGNGGPFRRAAIMRNGENCGGEQWNDGAQSIGFAPEPDVAGDGRRIRERLAGHLAECGVDPAQTERVLRGFAPAFARLAAFAESARRYTQALNCSIEHYPEGPSVVRRRCHRR
jgi:hypothetical protein